MHSLGILSTLFGLVLCGAAPLMDATAYSAMGSVGNLPAQHDQLLTLIGGGIFLIAGVLMIVGAKIIDAIKAG